MSPVHFLLLLLSLSLSPPIATAAPTDSLLAFKHSLTGPSAALETWAPGSDPCKDNWVGVFCDEDNKNVIRIHLQNMGLSGSIDVGSLSKVSSLVSLGLEKNNFSGSLPNFNGLHELRALFVHNNKFSGEIPDDYFSGLLKWRKIWLSNNEFTGKIPSSIAKLMNLGQLHLENNKFLGQIPEISQDSLKEFDVSNNELEGLIPESMYRFGGDAFKGNARVCGRVVGVECKEDSGFVGSPSVEDDGDDGGGSAKDAIGVAVGMVVAMAVALVLTMVLKLRRKGGQFTRLGKERMDDDDVVEVRVNGSSVSGGVGGGSSSRGVRKSIDGSSKKSGENSSRKGSQNGKTGISDLVMVNSEKGVFDLSDLMKASAEVLGSGGLGSAYMASMTNGVSVVVKRIRDMNKLCKDEFDWEMRKFGKMKHKNILTPLAYHYRKEEKLIVSEYVPKGSLLYVLHGDRSICHAELNWSTRLRIIKGIASGISFLHSEFSSSELPHGNLKSSNILLTDTYEPLLFDYGFIRLVTTHQAAHGMFAFKVPEVVANHQNVSPKCDVYCLGIVILEILTGKFPSQYLSANKDGIDVVQWVQTAIKEKKENEFLDPEITVSSPDSVGAMVKLLHVGLACVTSDPEKRPSMEDAIKKIEKVQD